MLKTLQALRILWTLYLGTALVMLGSGLQVTLLGIRSVDEFGSSTIAGYIMGSYSACFLISSFFAPTVIRRVGHIRVFAASVSLASGGVLLHSILIDPYIWALIRGITGFCYGIIYIVLESWINNVSTNDIRGKLFGVYMTITFLFLGLGQFCLLFFDPNGNELFILSSISLSLAIIPLVLTKISVPEIIDFKPFSVIHLYKLSPVAVVVSFFSGVLISGSTSMGAVYGKLIGLSNSDIVPLVVLPTLFPIIASVPIGYFSDKFDRRYILIIITIGIILFSLLSMMYGHTSYLYVFFTLAMGFCYPIYSLGASHANDLVTKDETVGANATIVLLYGVGSALAPTIVGLIMDIFGAKSYYVYFIIVALFLVVFIYLRIRSRDVPDENKGDFMNITPRSSTIANVAIAEEANKDNA